MYQYAERGIVQLNSSISPPLQTRVITFYARFSLGLDLARSCNSLSESDCLFLGKYVPDDLLIYLLRISVNLYTYATRTGLRLCLLFAFHVVPDDSHVRSPLVLSPR